MGNGNSVGNGTQSMRTPRRQKNQPRVVLESPAASTTDNSRQTRVTFANTRRQGSETLRARPQMTSIGEVQSDIFRNNGGRVKYTKSRSLQGSNSDMNQSITSVRSSASGPVDGVWEPSLDPYAQPNAGQHSQVSPEYSEPFHYRNWNTNHYNDYYGFEERDYAFGHRSVNGLSRVDEI